MFNRCPFPLFRFLGFCSIICGTIALGDLGGSVRLQSLSLSLLQCSVESVKQLVPPLPPRSLSRTHAHTRTHTRAGPNALVVCSHSGQCLATGHARRRPDQHPAHVRNVPSAVQPGGGRGRRGRARRGCRERAAREGERQEGAGTPDQGHRKGKTTSAKLFIFPKALQSAGGGGEEAPGVWGSQGFLGSEMLLPQFVRHYGAGT